ncbi:MAG: urea ABC transporter permease subunit UrtB [Cellvibrionaceae bacterium]
MRLLLAALILFPTSLLAISSESAVDTQLTTEQILPQFSTAKFKQKAKLIEQVERSGDGLSAVVLETLLKGELFYLKSDKGILSKVTQLDDAQYEVTQLNADKTVTVIEKKALKKQYKKVKTNNKLRKAIKLSLARINLVNGTVDEKLKALEGLLASKSRGVPDLIRPLYESEENADVKEMMSVVLAVSTLKDSDSIDEQLAAVEILTGRLETPVKVSLTKLYESLKGKKDSDSRKLRKKTEKALASIEDKVGFYQFIEKLFFGLSLGSVLLLAAIGLAITFGVMGVINMAHGEMIMIGAYTTYVIQLLMPNLIEYSLFVAIPAAFLMSGLVGVVIQRTVIRYLHGRPLETLLATFGISLILQQAVRTIFSPLNRQVVSPEWISGALELNPVLSLTYNRLYILAFSILVFITLVAIIKKTSLGLNVRAVSQNRDMAKAMGVRTEWVDAMTFGLGSGVAGVAGVALSQLTNVGPNLGQAYIIDSFMVVVFGGVGNLLGTLVGAFTLGVANKFMEPITGAVLANILVLVFIILFIQKRPKGLFPQKGRAAE